jgi:hypothetical protein
MRGDVMRHLVVQGAPVADSLSGGRVVWDEQSLTVVATEGDVLITTPDVRMRIVGTDDVHVERLSPGRDTAVAEAVQWFAPRVLLAHAGRFCLHADVVTVGGRVIVLTGSPGSGKSTTARALERRGGTRVTTDLAVVSVHDGGALVEALDGSVLAGPIDVIVDLRVRADARAPLVAADVTGVTKAVRLAAIGNVTAVSDFGSRAVPYRQWVADLSRAVPMMSISRPPDADMLAEVVALVLDRAGA